MGGWGRRIFTPLGGVNGLRVPGNAEGAALGERVRRGAEAAEVGGLDWVEWAHVLGRWARLRRTTAKCSAALFKSEPLTRAFRSETSIEDFLGLRAGQVPLRRPARACCGWRRAACALGGG